MQAKSGYQLIVDEKTYAVGENTNAAGKNEIGSSINLILTIKWINIDVFELSVHQFVAGRNRSRPCSCFYPPSCAKEIFSDRIPPLATDSSRQQLRGWSCSCQTPKTATANNPVYVLPARLRHPTTHADAGSTQKKLACITC